MTDESKDTPDNVKPRTVAEDTVSEELAPRRKGISGFLSRILSRSSVVNDQAESQKAFYRKQVLQDKIDLAGKVEEAVESQARLGWVQDNQDKIVDQVREQTAGEYDLKHAQRMMEQKEALADIDKRGSDLKKSEPKPVPKKKKASDVIEVVETIDEMQARHREADAKAAEAHARNMEHAESFPEDSREAKKSRYEELYRRLMRDLQNEQEAELSKLLSKKQ